MSFRAYDIEIGKTGSEQIKVRDYQEKLRLAQGELPGKKKEALDQLAQTRQYMLKVRKLKAQEDAQHGDIDKQVRGQEAKILEAAKDLSRQAGEARINIGKYRHAALEQKKLAITKHQDLVRRFWRDTLMGLEVLTLKQGQFDLMMYRACTALSRAVFGRGTAKYRVIYPQLPVVTEGEMPPKWSEIKSADKRIGQIAKAEREQNGKIDKHRRSLGDAADKLKQRSDGAHAKVEKAKAERDKQLVKGLKQKQALGDHIRKLDAREKQLAGEQGRMTDAERQLAARKGQLLQGRAKAVASKKYNAQVQAYLAPIFAYQKAAAAAKKAGKKPPAPPRLGPKPNLPGWFKKRLNPAVRKYF